MPSGEKASPEQVKQATELLAEINYTGFFKRMVSFQKKEMRGKLTVEEAELFAEMQERNVKAYFRMKRWFLKNKTTF
jgi:hypothetical protein